LRRRQSRFVPGTVSRVTTPSLPSDKVRQTSRLASGYRRSGEYPGDVMKRLEGGIRHLRANGCARWYSPGVTPRRFITSPGYSPGPPVAPRPTYSFVLPYPMVATASVTLETVPGTNRDCRRLNKIVADHTAEDRSPETADIESASNCAEPAHRPSRCPCPCSPISSIEVLDRMRGTPSADMARRPHQASRTRIESFL